MKPAQKRFALLIGNSAYKNYKSLRNSVNDAQDLAKVLHRLGFEVTIKTNLNLRKMKTAIRKFRKKLYKHKQSIGLFYFSGHGTMYNKYNYLIPIGAITIKPRSLFRNLQPTQKSQ